MWCSDVHELNALSLVSSSPSPSVTVVNPEQRAIPPFFIVFTDLGMMMLSRDLQYPYARIPISFSPYPRVTAVKPPAIIECIVLDRLNVAGYDDLF